jgi:hypothetical protein
MEQVSAKLKWVLAENSAARREQPKAVAQIEKEIFGVSGKHTESCPLIPEPCPLVERVAYIWFNRFCALRFMDVNRYTRIGVVSPTEGQFQPEILAEAKMGHIDEEMASDKIRQQIFALLDGKAPSRDPQGEAYRLLVVAACNFWNKAMPFLFQRIDDYTELLMPDDLLSGNSILATTREAMTLDACADVEVIGWLYQFYISEKKDEVFDGLKKNKKITPENIPAATQLFTPHWIVRYLVENSLGRLWLLNRPNSRLKERMDYYIEPQMDTDEHRLKDNEKNICVNLCESVVQNYFQPDKDNVIPILDGDWFTDDISERFREFLKIAFGADHYQENLRFIEESLNIKGKRNYTIRDYFLNEFYTDHVKRYKKRPIYWLFSSPKGSFNALIYLHRYRPDTVSVVLNDYLREFRTKLTAHKNHLEAVSISASASQGEKTKALKEIENLKKIIAELEEYEREVLYPLATEQVAIDLDDGVKINYPKFGAALKKIPGLDAKED